MKKPLFSLFVNPSKNKFSCCGKSIFVKYQFLMIYFFIFSLPEINAQINNHDEIIIPPNKCRFEVNNRKNLNKKDKILDDSMDNRPIMQTQILSKSKNFIIHYDTSGYNAVSLIDINQNKVSDYIDSVAFYFDYAWKVEIDTLGFPHPLSDSGTGGSDATDIYVLEMGLEPCAVYGWTVGDSEVNYPGIPVRLPSYIQIDNNYSILDSNICNGKKIRSYQGSYGFNALKATIAHEFNHVLQNAGGIPDGFQSSIAEMSSVYMEYRVFPYVKDYYMYLPGLFRYLEKNSFGDASTGGGKGYPWGIFFQYIQSDFGDSTLVNMWKKVGTGKDGYGALDLALNDCGSSLPDAFCKFLPWMYYTGKRAGLGKSFKNAAEFPTLQFDTSHYPAYKFEAPKIKDIDFLNAFEIKPVRFIFGELKSFTTPDTLDILITNHDLIGARFQTGDSVKYIATCSDSTFIETYSQKIGQTPFYFSMEPDSLICSTGTNLFLSGVHSECDTVVFPNPLYLSQVNSDYYSDNIFFPVPCALTFDDKARLTIYDSEMHQIFEKQLQITPHPLYDNSHPNVTTRRVVALDYKSDIPDLTTGVYIYSIRVNINDDDRNISSTILGKFAVIK
ncbi:MAG: hypothetical protein HW421_1474 [Ignavibacteria bacterium]|nr:hypothetical protein [Ignavibacteria bacterium]